jgi:hypothetical protein
MKIGVFVLHGSFFACGEPPFERLYALLLIFVIEDG